jgi:hypothetical protein
MDQDRLVLSSVPVSLGGEGCHPALELPLKPHRVVIITQRPQQNSRLPFFKTRWYLKGVYG